MKNVGSAVLILLIVTALLTTEVRGMEGNNIETWPGFPSVQSLPAIQHIPNPYLFFNAANDPDGNGTVSSPQEWAARRDEIKELVQRYWLGYRWPTPAKDVSGETYVKIEPNEISLGFDFPPMSAATRHDLLEEFQHLAEHLQKNQVEIREIIPPEAPFAPPVLGDVLKTFGPVDSSEAVKTALEAWNFGYYIPYSMFGATYYATLKEFTGEITSPPNPTKPVTYNTITITNPDNGEEASFNIQINVPDAQQRAAIWGSSDVSVPAIIDIGGTISQIDEVKKQGYAHISFVPTDIYADGSGAERHGLYTTLYPYDKDVYEYASGALMAWGWAASQILNALEQPTIGGQNWGDSLNINPAQSLVTGHSRYGKAALFAAAFDERISICVPSEAGGSGIQSYRYKVEGKIFNFNTYPKADRVYGKTEIPTVSYGSGSSWFPDTAGQFVNKDDRIPFDASSIIALVAPRPFFTTTGIDAHWLGNEGAIASVEAAAQVYRFIGETDLEKTNIAIRARESDHVFYNRDLPFVIAIMDREFKQADDQLLHVEDLFPEGTSLGSFSYPAQDYMFLSDFNSYPLDINSSYLPWSNPDEYTLWTAQETFLTGFPIVITAHSNAPVVRLISPSGEIHTADEKAEDVFYFRLTESQTPYGRYTLEASGPEKAERKVHFAAVSLADALRHATSKGEEGEENRLIGFSSRIANNEEDPPLVYVEGEGATMSFTPERFKPEETTLLEYGILFHDRLFAKIANQGWDDSKTFVIKNLKFVSLPDFTFQMSFGEIFASADNGGKFGAERFTQPISWQVERYNNGPAPVWPPIPDTMEEKRAVLAGQAVIRPNAPQPQPTAFEAEIITTEIRRDGAKTAISLSFDQRMDSREYGFGLDVAKEWTTLWSADEKTVTLLLDYDLFPRGDTANLIIFRLMDADRNLIPGPWKISLLFSED